MSGAPRPIAEGTDPAQKKQPAACAAGCESQILFSALPAGPVSNPPAKNSYVRPNQMPPVPSPLFPRAILGAVSEIYTWNTAQPSNIPSGKTLPENAGAGFSTR